MVDGVIVFKIIFLFGVMFDWFEFVFLEMERVKCFLGKGGGLFSLENVVSSSEFVVFNCESITFGFLANGLISDILHFFFFVRVGKGSTTFL